MRDSCEWLWVVFGMVILGQTRLRAAENELSPEAVARLDHLSFLIMAIVLMVSLLCLIWRKLINGRFSFAIGSPAIGMVLIVGMSMALVKMGLFPIHSQGGSSSNAANLKEMPTDDIRKKRIERLRDALWAYAATHQGNLPRDQGLADFPATLWVSPDKAGSPYGYLSPVYYGSGERTLGSSMQFGFAKRNGGLKGGGRYEVFTGDARRYLLVYEPPSFGAERFVITSTGHVLKMESSALASRAQNESQELWEAKTPKAQP